MTYHSCEYISKCEKNSDYILTGKRGVHSMQEKRRWTRNLVSCGEWNTCNIWFLPAPGRSISCKLLSSRLSNSTWSGPPTKRERKREGEQREQRWREDLIMSTMFSAQRAIVGLCKICWGKTTLNQILMGWERQDHMLLKTKFSAGTIARYTS